MVVLKFYFVVFPHEAISEEDEVMDHKQFNIWIAGCWSTEFWTRPCIIRKIFSAVCIFSQRAGVGVALNVGWVHSAVGCPISSQEELNGGVAFQMCALWMNA